MYTRTGTSDKEQTIHQYAPLVKRLAHRLAAKLPPSVSVDDMIQAGMMGLMDAANNFRQDHGTLFEAYATQRIRGAMLDELRQNDWMPRGVRAAQRRIEKAITQLEQRLGRPATEIEMAKEMGMSLEQYQDLLNIARGSQLLYLDDLGDAESDEQYVERNISDGRPDPLAQIEDEQFRTALIAAIENLPDREKTLMSLYYEQELNFREIAAVLGVTESRVCQIHTQTVARLRTKLKGWVGARAAEVN
jgi:RNA polymerase sigma factor FliA